MWQFLKAGGAIAPLHPWLRRHWFQVFNTSWLYIRIWRTAWLLKLISFFDHSVKTGYPEKRVGSSGIFRTIFGQDAMTFNPKLKWLHHYRKMAERRMFIFQRCAIPVRLNFSHFICRLRIFEVCESYIVRHSDTTAWEW